MKYKKKRLNKSRNFLTLWKKNCYFFPIFFKNYRLFTFFRNRVSDQVYLWWVWHSLRFDLIPPRINISRSHQFYTDLKSASSVFWIARSLSFRTLVFSTPSALHREISLLTELESLMTLLVSLVMWDDLSSPKDFILFFASLTVGLSQ